MSKPSQEIGIKHILLLILFAAIATFSSIFITRSIIAHAEQYDTQVDTGKFEVEAVFMGVPGDYQIATVRSAGGVAIRWLSSFKGTGTSDQQLIADVPDDLPMFVEYTVCRNRFGVTRAYYTIHIHNLFDLHGQNYGKLSRQAPDSENGDQHSFSF